VTRTVWKYAIPVVPSSATVPTVKAVPSGARFLHVAEQFGDITLWFEVDPDAPKVRRGWLLVGTGHPFDEHLTYVGTTLHAGGSLVLHVYEISEVSP
jgi:hypothetical protein